MNSKAKIGGMIIEEVKKQSTLESVHISWIIETAKKYHIADESITKHLADYINRESFDTLKKEIVFDEETKTQMLEIIHLLNTITYKLDKKRILEFIIIFYCKEWKIY